MNVLTTPNQAPGTQQEIYGKGTSSFATVAVAGASASGAQRTNSGLNPGSGLATFTLSGVAIMPTASGTYLVTGEVIIATSLAANVTLELLLDGVPQAIGANGATSVVFPTLATTQTPFDWTELIFANPATNHTWSIRITTSAGTFSAGGEMKLLLVELG